MSLAERRRAAEKYRPRHVELLLVAEAPPCALDRYFYFESVDRHDWLFRYVWEGLMGEKPARAEKARHLAALREVGVFMIDLHEENVSQPTMAELKPCVPGLVERCLAIKPRRVALIKSIVHDAAYEALREAGVAVIDERIPFPASGQQKKFLEAFGRVAAECGFKGRTGARPVAGARR